MAGFPNVPNVPGVPTLLRSGLAQAAVSLLVADAIGFLSGFFAPRWGIYLNGVRAVPADSVVSFDFKNDSRVADYPIERGGFESYDKVANPFETRLRLASGGSEIERTLMLQAVEIAQASLNLYDIVTPERTYTSANIDRYDYRRTNNSGVGMMIIDVVAVEIRERSAQAFSNTQAPSGASTVSGGTVQTSPVTQAQSGITVQ